MKIQSHSMSQAEIDDKVADMGRDLEALFNVIMDDVLEIMERNEDMEPEDVITEIMKLFGGHDEKA